MDHLVINLEKIISTLCLFGADNFDVKKLKRNIGSLVADVVNFYVKKRPIPYENFSTADYDDMLSMLVNLSECLINERNSENEMLNSSSGQ